MMRRKHNLIKIVKEGPIVSTGTLGLRTQVSGPTTVSAIAEASSDENQKSRNSFIEADV